MSVSTPGKLNRLLQDLSDYTLVSARWLRANGYPSNLVARYVSSGWLQSPTRGVYLRKSGTPTWAGLLHSLQSLEQLPIHAGGRFALARQGHGHYLRLGEPATLTLYGDAKLPAWALKLPLPERVQACGRSPFDLPPLSLADTTSEETLNAQGLERVTDNTGAGAVVLSMPERAILELCDEPPDAALVHEVNALMPGLATLRPQLLGTLLQHCRSIKAKRLFLALAERHHHAWLPHLDLQKVDLGSGKRVLVRGGKLDAKYHITLPADLDEQLGYRHSHEVVPASRLQAMKRAGQAQSRHLVASGAVAADAVFLLRGEQVTKARVSWPDAPLSAAAAAREKRGERSTDPATAA